MQDRASIQAANCNLHNPALARGPLESRIRLARTLLLLGTAAVLPLRPDIMKNKLKKFASIWVCQACEAANSISADLCLRCGRGRNRRERLGLRH
jgi:ribosomal protein L40E